MKTTVTIAIVAIHQEQFAEGRAFLLSQPIDPIALQLVHDRFNLVDPNAVMLTLFSYSLGYVSAVELRKLGAHPETAEIIDLVIKDNCYHLTVEITDFEPLQYKKVLIDLPLEFIIPFDPKDKKVCSAIGVVQKFLKQFQTEGSDMNFTRLDKALSMLFGCYQPSLCASVVYFVADMVEEIDHLLQSHSTDDKRSDVMQQWRSQFVTYRRESMQKEVKLAVYDRYAAYAETQAEETGAKYWHYLCNLYRHEPTYRELQHEIDKLNKQLANYLNFCNDSDPKAKEILVQRMSYCFHSAEEIQSYFSCKVIVEYLEKKMRKKTENIIDSRKSYNESIQVITEKVVVNGDNIDNHGTVITHGSDQYRLNIQNMNNYEPTLKNCK